MSRQRPRIAHVITSLGPGGAEYMLVRLLEQLRDGVFEPVVIGLRSPEAIGPVIERLGVPVRSLAMPPGVPNPWAVARLARMLRQERPDIVQTWMYHADLLGGLAARGAGGPPVVWGIHNTTLEAGASKRTTMLIARSCARLSRVVPAAIVCCAEAAREVHIARGYDAGRMVTIPNGFDTDRFRPDPDASAELRPRIGAGSETPLVGLVARFHPQKDHHTFVEAAGRIAATHPTARFVLAGQRCDAENAELMGWIDATGARNRFALLGRTDHPERVLAALDIAVLSSRAGEAFPLVVGEAMACGTPCVATDIGDAARIVGDTGRVVPIRQPAALAASIGELIALPAEARAALGERARARIIATYSLPDIAARYESLWQRIAFDRGERAA